MQIVGIKNPIRGKLREKIGILSTHNFSRQQLATVCRNSVAKMQLSGPLTFLTHDAIGKKS